MDVRSLFKLDAACEAVLALLLIVGGAAGWLTGADFPDPVGRTAVIVAGAALGLFALVLVARTRSGPERGSLLALALANEATALAGLVWLIAGHGFSTAGAAILVATVAGLFALSVVQLRTAMTGRRRPAMD
jgi:hypothetical protein